MPSLPDGRIAVVGATSWGTTLAVILARNGRKVVLLTRDDAEAGSLKAAGENARLLPGVPLPPALAITGDPEAALERTALVLLAVPSQTMRANLRRIGPALPTDAILVSAAKGLELGTGRRMSELIAEEAFRNSGICALSGPNLAREIARDLPAASVVACSDIRVAEIAQNLLMTPFFRLYAHDDLIGVELGGTLKNVIALGAGMADGLEVGDNAKAAFITRGVAEMTRLGVRAGANPLTFASLAGLGDLNATCYSRLSRNRTLGEQIARGKSLDEVLTGMPSVVEGVPTTSAARELASRLGVEMPITEMIYRILFERVSPRRAVVELMLREPKRELAGLWGPEARPAAG
jgi:glycerol-3-phosphate dehydrogenase (NAD(P)+)